MKVGFIRKGAKIVESCLDKCERLQFSVNVFRPNQDVMDMLLDKDYLKLHFNGNDLDSDVLIFHNSEDEYAHNGDIAFMCFLSQSPKVLKCVRKHKKAKALIEEMKKKGGDLSENEN